MKKLFEVRKEHGGVFVTVFPGGLLIPWKPLSIGDYLKYHTDSTRGFIPSGLLEDEIFSKCVLDPTILRQVKFLEAGIITTVVQNIWQYSGPIGIDAFNRDLQTARDVVFSEELKGINQIVQLITIAYPYKLEEVYAMDYETFMLRAAMAEAKLLEMRIIPEPIEMKIPEVKESQEPNKDRPKIDAKALWEAQQRVGLSGGPKEKQGPRIASQKLSEVSKKGTKKKDQKSPVLEQLNKNSIKNKKEKLINFTAEQQEIDSFHLDNHDRREHKIVRDHILNEKLGKEKEKLVEDAQWIYADVIKELNKKNQKK